MIKLRKSEERGQADRGWMKACYSFSFASYFDPKHMKFRALRVLNEDRIKGGKGFDAHPHENMEIITYIISGELEHKDSMGNNFVMHSGELQRMTAGTGVTHSEFNPSDKDTHLFQIWISPERSGLSPGYEQHDFTELKKQNALTLLASRTGGEDCLTVHQDLALYCGLLEQGQALHHSIKLDRHVWVQVVEGILDINGTVLHAGDGCAISDEKKLTIAADQSSEFLLFDLA
jgi:redox-sensitive bicupin YhaK (pirin superfamily)